MKLTLLDKYQNLVISIDESIGTSNLDTTLIDIMQYYFD